MAVKHNSIESLEHRYSDRYSKDLAYLLLHGVRGGIDELYIETLMEKITNRGDTALAFNFPYMSRGETTLSSDTFEEEITALQTAYDFLKAVGKKRVHIIAKSAGGIIASHWLNQNPDTDAVNVSIMGYIGGKGGIITDALRGRLDTVVQGEHDRYSTADEVRAELLAHHVEGVVVEIPNADHSYRDTASPTPPPYAHQAKAIDELLKRI